MVNAATIGTVEERVRRGAELMDRAVPNWAARIDLDRLTMSSCDSCLLGQVLGNYFDGPRVLGPFAPLGRHLASSYGFNATDQSEGEDSPEFVALARAWRAEVRARIEGDTNHA